jgi:hypothetical protein
MFGHTTPKVVERALSVTLMGDDEEQMASAIYPALVVSEQKTYLVSSLGAVEAVSESGGPWSLGGVEFSVAAQNAVVGQTLYFAAVSLKGGQCVVNVTYQEGVLQPERVQMILEGVAKRLKMLLDNEEYERNRL